MDKDLNLAEIEYLRDSLMERISKDRFGWLLSLCHRTPGTCL